MPRLRYRDQGKMRGFERTVTIGPGASVQLALASALRQTLRVSSHITQSYFITTVNPAVASLGLLIPTVTQSTVLDLETHGDIVQQAWFAFNPGAGAITVGVFEAVGDGTLPLSENY